MPEADPPFEDPRRMRALAHPARLAILDALAGGDELTATDCAQLTGLTPSATAYHLRLLQRFDLVEPGEPRPDGRERPWRATGRHRRARIDTSTPGGAASAAAILDFVLDRSRRIAIEAELAAADRGKPSEWDDLTSLSSQDLWLTAGEARAVLDRLDQVLEPFRERRQSARPGGSRRVRVLRLVAPHPAGPPEGDAVPGEPLHREREGIGRDAPLAEKRGLPHGRKHGVREKGNSLP